MSVLKFEPVPHWPRVLGGELLAGEPARPIDFVTTWAELASSGISDPSVFHSDESCEGSSAQRDLAVSHGDENRQGALGAEMDLYTAAGERVSFELCG